MSLKPCKECKKPLSSKIKVGESCPHCKNPDPLNKRRDDIIAYFLLSVVVITLIWWKFGDQIQAMIHQFG